MERAATNITGQSAAVPTRLGVITMIDAEFREMPGLALSVPEAARLWRLDLRLADQVLDELSDRGVLVRDSRGVYHRRGRCPRC